MDAVAVWTPGLGELIIILVVVLLLFGAKRLPEMARSLGRSTKEFKKGMDDEAEEAEEDERREVDESRPAGDPPTSSR
ncbi:MAG TPA: twin-arginine translocase TatA/TatE family subunit [Actinomycetota bacterium]